MRRQFMVTAHTELDCKGCNGRIAVRWNYIVILDYELEIEEQCVRINVFFDPIPRAELLVPRGCKFKKTPTISVYHSEICQESTTKMLSKAAAAH